MFWKLTQVFGWWYYGTAPPLVNAGVLLGRADILSHLCSAILKEAELTGERDDQRILNSLVAHDGRRGVDTVVVDRGAAEGAFADVQEASDVVAAHMTVGIRPQFSANETAKDFAYVPGLLSEHAPTRCRLGPGAGLRTSY